MARVPLMPTSQSASDLQRAASAKGMRSVSARKDSKAVRMDAGVIDCSHSREMGCLALVC